MLDGRDSTDFASASDRNNLQNQINNINNNRLITQDVPNGHIKRIDGALELHLSLSNIIGTTTFPVTFSRIDSVLVFISSATYRAGWCNFDAVTNNSVTVSGSMMSHGNLDDIDSVAGYISVFGRG